MHCHKFELAVIWVVQCKQVASTPCTNARAQWLAAWNCKNV